MWRTVEADGCVWEVRAVQNPDLGIRADQSLLEFRPSDGNRSPRRVVVDKVDLGAMTDIEIRAAYFQSRPIGGDHYGRPGKRMADAG